MGGKKKLGLKQMERMQKKRDSEDKKKEKKKEKAKPQKERRTIAVVAPEAKNEKIIGDIRKMKALTPYAVASRFSIRISAAKDFLEQLEQNGAVQLVSGSHRIKIYKPVEV